MSDNAIKCDDGKVAVYTHDIYCFADEFISEELEGKDENVHDNFLRMIFYIADRIQKPDNGDIQLLDAIFDVFVRLCAKYGVLPTLEAFSFLVTINRATFSDWRNGEYRKGSGHGNAVKRWFDVCKSFTVEKLHNSPKTDVNLIFIAKAAYKMRETSPEIPDNTFGIPQASREEIAARYQAMQAIDGPEDEVLHLD